VQFVVPKTLPPAPSARRSREAPRSKHKEPSTKPERSSFPLPSAAAFPQCGSVILEQAIDRLYQLNVGTTPVAEGAPHEKPHKPLLLLAAFDLIDEGLATPEHIPWCQELRDRFTARFLLVKKHNDQNNPDLPFRYLAGDGFWQAFENNGTTPVRREIRVSDIGQVFARFTDGFEHLVAIPATRQLMREALISRYFPSLFSSLPPSTIPDPRSRVAEEPPEYGRSPAFRRKILTIYDHQCAACGLRIKLPAGNDVSFIDAAHLIPFSESRNDHPTNGLALCKNHHWAMDRHLIAPAPDHHWHVSRILDPRRSNGEKELTELSGKSLLLPQDEAFHPDAEGLEWRSQRLSA
jgi:putative restriction endonuclease